MSPELNTIKTLPIRARSAFLLALASRCAATIRDEETKRIARAAIDDAWRWEEGEGISALKIYENHSESLGVASSVLPEGHDSTALGAAISTVYYVLWHAFQLQINEGRVNPGEVPNDMADMTEEVFDEACDYALRAIPGEGKWITGITRRLVKNCEKGPGTLGMPILSSFFAD